MQRDPVSILVFVEVALGLQPILANVTASHMFQSLFSWKSPSDRTGSHISTVIRLVSILVFVEVALGQTRLKFITPKTSWFQSLFSWKSPSDSGSARRGMSLSVSFNPCFRGSRPRTSDLVGTPYVNTAYSLFQSLFSWKSPSDPVKPALFSHANTVSILVFVEVALGHRNCSPYI